MQKVLIADAVSPAAVAVLDAAEGIEVIRSNKDEFREHLAEADAMLVRSAVKVTKDVLEAAPNLKAVGRAGVGVDNVDIEVELDPELSLSIGPAKGPTYALPAVRITVGRSG